MKPNFIRTIFTAGVFAAISGAPCAACDFCVCPTPNIEITASRPVSFYAGVAEQFTHFGTLREDGVSIENPVGQYLDSSITQVFLGASFLENRFSLQMNLPFISRKFKRPGESGIEHGSESGFGDMSLLLSYRLFQTDSGGAAASVAGGKRSKAVASVGDPEFSMWVDVMAGLKFPTGDSSRLAEEAEEGHRHEGGHDEDPHDAPESGVHGHDLALGSGSGDGIFGAESFLRYRELFFEAEIQYAVRRTGDFDYRYANDLIWSAGPGIYLVRDKGRSVALQAELSGEYKGKDTHQGEEAGDTGITSLFLGPRMLATFGRWSAELGFGWPAVMHNTALQITPDFRIRANVTCRF